MSLLVINCNHWIGFHLVNSLLELEYAVDGVINEEEDNDLSMFFGRNSLFSFVSSKQNMAYDACFIIGEKTWEKEIPSERVFFINPDHPIDDTDLENATVITTPLLFGEWMPMNKHGLYQDDEWVSFKSERFLEDGVYIKNFINSLLQLIKVEKLPSRITIYSKNKRNETSTLENTVFIRDNGNIEEKVNQIITHYKKYRTF